MGGDFEMILEPAEKIILNNLTLRAEDILKIADIPVKSSKADKEKKAVHVDIRNLLRNSVTLLNEAWL